MDGSDSSESSRSEEEDGEDKKKKKKQETKLVPSAESLESFERIVKRRREKNRKQRIKPIYRKILESDVHQFKVLKFMLHFPFGLVFGFALFKISLDRLEFSPETAIQIAVAFILIFSVCFALFVTFRCLAVLLVPHLFGEVGRIYLYTICVGIVISGPLANFLLNIGEVLRSIGCQFEIFVNLTVSRIAIRAMPLLDTMMDVIGNQVDLQSMAQDLAASVVPIRVETGTDEGENDQLKKEIVEDEVDMELESRVEAIEVRFKMTGQESKMKRAQMKLMRSLEIKCERILASALGSCSRSFKTAYKNCMNKLSFIGYLICWVWRITVFCDMFKSIPTKLGISCTSMQYVNEKFSETVDVIDELIGSIEANFEANMQYEGEDAEEVSEEKGESEGVGFITKSVLWQFKSKKVIFEVVFQVLQRLMVLIFIFLIYRAQHYMQLYLTVIDYDNRYVTSYFERIDERRAVETKRTLLPLKKLEQREVSYMCSIRMTDQEKAELFRSLVRSTVIIVMVLGLIIFDYLLAEIMEFVSSIARMDFIQHGRHHIGLNLTGTGILATMLRTVFHGFNHTTIIDNVVSNAACMPQPYRTSWTEHWIVFLCIAAIYLTAIFEAPVMRSRRLVCDFFFPKREKTRVLFLYNDMLRKRVGFLHEARHKVRKKCKKNQFYIPLGFFTSLRYQFPGCCEWLRYVGLGRQRCLICNDLETGEFIHCPTFLCKATYCRQCWIDVNAKCYACRDDDDWTVVSSGGGSQVALLNAKSPWQTEAR